ncbi:MAG TPA: Ku protein [Parvibaculum sp.]
MARRATKNRTPAKKRHPVSGSAGRPLWTGQLRLALVSVPVLLYSATKSGARLAFHQVHKPSGKRIRYEKTVPGIGAVDTDEIFKGYEISKGHYVVLSDKDFDQVKIEARKTFDLVQFVDYCEIDPIYFDKPYYVVPDGDLAEDAYRVFRDALRSTQKMGIGQFVMRGREYIAALKPCGDGMLIETLRFADEVREAAPLFADIGNAKSDTELLNLAKELIKRKSSAFDPEDFKDKYTDALRTLIEARAKKTKPVEVEDDELPSEGAQVIDLVEALKRSVRGNKRAKTPARSSAAKTKPAKAKPHRKAG